MPTSTPTPTAHTAPTTLTTQRRKRAARQFYISIRSDCKTNNKEEGKIPQEAGGSVVATKPEGRKKYSHRVKAAFSTLEDDLARFAKQKLGHWGLVVEAYPNDPDSKRFFEICTKHTDEWVDDSDQSDRYEDDEADGLPAAGGFDRGVLGMRVGRQPKKPPRGRPELTFSEPDYNTLGGVWWKLLSTLKSTTRFSNSEIRNEAERIWRRQQDYRFIDNNCQRFCILLAIHIRAKQSTTLRLLNGKILKKQAGKTEKTIGAVGKFLRQGKSHS